MSVFLSNLREVQSLIVKATFVQGKPTFEKGIICQYPCLIKLHTQQLRYAHTVAAVPMTHEIVQGELVQELASAAMSLLQCQLSALAMIVAALHIFHEIAQKRRLATNVAALLIWHDIVQDEPAQDLVSVVMSLLLYHPHVPAASVAALLICHESAQDELVQDSASAVKLRSLCVRSL